MTEVSQNLKLELDIFKLIQPELLNAEQLAAVLIERGVDANSIPEDKETLLSLFKRIAYPLPQREYRQDHRGTILTQRRTKDERIKFNESSTTNQDTFTIGVSGNRHNKRASTSSCQASSDRLNPPPDFINFERKKIRLNSSSELDVTSKSASTELDKIIIKQHNPSENCTEYENKRRSSDLNSNQMVCENQTGPKVTHNSEGHSENGSCSEQVNNMKGKSESKKIKLKRNHLLSTDTSVPIECTAEKLATEPKKPKIKPITWP